MSLASGNDINDQPQKSLATIHQQSKTSPTGRNDIDKHLENGPATDFGAKAASLV